MWLRVTQLELEYQLLKNRRKSFRSKMKKPKPPKPIPLPTVS